MPSRSCALFTPSIERNLPSEEPDALTALVRICGGAVLGNQPLYPIFHRRLSIHHAGAAPPPQSLGRTLELTPAIVLFSLHMTKAVQFAAIPRFRPAQLILFSIASLASLQ